jgi:5'-nucleotidase
VVNGVTLVKGGTDFRELAEVVLDTNVRDSRTGMASVRSAHIHEVTSALPCDLEMETLIDQVGGEVEKKLRKVVAHISHELVASASMARTRECNVGNLITDCMRAQYSSEVALLNGGSIRSDSVYEKGDFTLGMLTQILPFPDMLVVLRARGSDIWSALENGVQNYPAEDGRFLQVCVCVCVCVCASE